MKPLLNIFTKSDWNLLEQELTQIRKSPKMNEPFYPMGTPCECDLCKRSRFITIIKDCLNRHGHTTLAQDLDDVYNGIIDQEEEDDMKIADLQERVNELEKKNNDLIAQPNSKQEQKIKDLTSELADADKEFEALEDAYEDLEEKLSEYKKEIDRKETLIKDYQGQLKNYKLTTDKTNVTIGNLEKENQRLKVALDAADKRVEELKSKQPHPADIKMAEIIKKAFQELQVAQLEKGLMRHSDYKPILV